MMKSVRSDFREIVGLDEAEDSTPLRPSEAIRKLWLQVADTYDVLALQPLWRYQAHTLSRHVEVVGRPRKVTWAMWLCAVEVCAFAGRPVPEALQRIRVEVANPSWGRVQDAVEQLAFSWEEIGR